MMNWLHYLLEANIYLGVFYLAYCLFLNKETYYGLNRLYLILSCVTAFILPVLQLGILEAPAVATTVSYTISQPASVTETMPVATPVVEQTITLQDALCYIYAAGAVIFLVVLIIKLLSLVKLISSNKVIIEDGYKLIYLPESSAAFSFLGYLFIGTHAPKEHIVIRHELVHIRQKHSADIIFLELLKVINWFNPLIYLLQNSLKTVHEYIADEKTVDTEDEAISYSSFLVNNAYGIGGPSITHSFFNYNLLKKRIIMLNQQRSGSLARLKYLVAVPIGAALLCASTLGFSKTYGWIDLAPQKAVKINSEEPPKVIESAYLGLMNHVSKNMRYKNEDAGKSGFSLVDFTITNDHKLKNVSLTKTFLRAGLKDQILNSFASYNGIVNDKPGKHSLGIVLTSPNDTVSINPNIKRISGYAGEIVLNVPPAPPKTNTDKIALPDMPGGFKAEKTYINAKGYKIEEGGYTVKNKTYYRVNISNPSGNKIQYPNGTLADKLVYFKSQNDISQMKMLNEKYGYKFPDVQVSALPKPTINQIRFPHPVITDKVLFPVATNEFNKYLAKNIRYPAEARENNIMGNIVIQFKIDETHHVADPRVISGIGHGCDEEALRVLRSYPDKSQANKGTYVMVITFALGNDDDSVPLPPIKPINKNIKTAKNYAGQVTVVGYAVHK